MCKQDTTNLFLSFHLLLVSETLPACVRVCVRACQLGDTHEVSQLLLGQKTGNTTELKAGSEDCRRHFTAEHIKTWDRLSLITGIAQHRSIMNNQATYEDSSLKTGG